MSRKSIASGWVAAAAVCFGVAAGGWTGAAFAADAPADPSSAGRSVPGTVVPSSGTTAPPPSALPPVPPPRLPARASSGTAGSLSGPAGIVGSGASSSAECTALRREYARSQACFAPYRLANGGLKPEAFKRCKEVENPSVRCGSAVAN